MTEQHELKWCPKCRQHKEKEKFYKRKRVGGRLVEQSWCIACTNALSKSQKAVRAGLKVKRRYLDIPISQWEAIKDIGRSFQQYPKDVVADCIRIGLDTKIKALGYSDMYDYQSKVAMAHVDGLLAEHPMTSAPVRRVGRKPSKLAEKVQVDGEVDR